MKILFFGLLVVLLPLRSFAAGNTSSECGFKLVEMERTTLESVTEEGYICTMGEIDEADDSRVARVYNCLGDYEDARLTFNVYPSVISECKILVMIELSDDPFTITVYDENENWIEIPNFNWCHKRTKECFNSQTDPY
ncbi:MAG: hypothetical protein OXB84_08915 [Halobacteriovoraceae bacterium]|nr:hypothetical protein [Halobacteriovoraceae bacterium]